MARNPKWLRNELILALDLYLRVGIVGAEHPEVVQLSKDLNRLHVELGAAGSESYWNPNGVSMKLSNFARFDPNYDGVGLSLGSRLDEEVWAESSGDVKSLKSTMAAINNDQTLSSSSNPIA